MPVTNLVANLCIHSERLTSASAFGMPYSRCGHTNTPPNGMEAYFERSMKEEKENSEFKPVKLCLKIDLVSYPARAEGLVNMVK